MTKSLKFTKIKHTFEQGLKKTVIWYKEYFEN